MKVIIQMVGVAIAVLALTACSSNNTAGTSAWKGSSNATANTGSMHDYKGERN